MMFMAIFIIWAGHTFFSQSSEIEQKSQLLSDRQAVMATGEQSLNQLNHELNRLKDPEYIGQIAMKKYGLYKPGEIPVRVSDSGSEND
jgi:cell division protein DivIC